VSENYISNHHLSDEAGAQTKPSSGRLSLEAAIDWPQNSRGALPECIGNTQEGPQILLLPEGPVVTFSSMPPLVEGHWCDHTSLHQHTFVTHDGEALMAARPVPGVELLCGQQAASTHPTLLNHWIAFNWQGRLMYVYSLAPHVVVSARPLDGACMPVHSTIFAPVTAMHQRLWLHGSGTATLVRPRKALLYLYCTPFIPHSDELIRTHLVCAPPATATAALHGRLRWGKGVRSWDGAALVRRTTC